jgi:hypothetical protein
MELHLTRDAGIATPLIIIELLFITIADALSLAGNYNQAQIVLMDTVQRMLLNIALNIFRHRDG